MIGRHSNNSRFIPLVLVAVASLLAARVSAQSAKSAHPAAKPSTNKAVVPSGPTTLVGVYTDEQAVRGKDVYAGSCRSCHTPASHTGATFNKWWRGKRLSDLFNFVQAQMPKNDPGSLASDDVADVVAYLLKMNAMPVGPNELPADVDSLKKFRIEAKPKSSTPTAKRGS